MLGLSYFGFDFLLEKKDQNAFWKCDEKIIVSPFSFLSDLQRYSKLHVVYLQIIQ